MAADSELAFCLLASGSGGNATVVECGDVRLLVDAGLSGKRIVERAARVGYDLATFTAILLSHEHGDHISAAKTLARRFGLPVYATRGTAKAGERALRGVQDLRFFNIGEPLGFGPLTVHPYQTPHDVEEGSGFVFDSPAGRLGWAMDLGSVTTLVRERLRGCRGLILEFNHDEALVRSGTRPWPVKQRILGDHGHLSNEAAAALLAEVTHDGLTHVVAAHRSQDHNTPQRPAELMRRATATRRTPAPTLFTADQHEPTPVFRLAGPAPE